MDFTSLLIGVIIGGIIIGAIAWSVTEKLRGELVAAQKECSRLQSEMQEAEECGKGIEIYNERLSARKESGKRQVLVVLKVKKKISNAEIVGLLDVSSATAVRYMDELEREGKVHQVGSTGRGVYYALNASNAG